MINSFVFAIIVSLLISLLGIVGMGNMLVDDPFNLDKIKYFNKDF
jgi:hypothetical protein